MSSSNKIHDQEVTATSTAGSNDIAGYRKIPIDNLTLSTDNEFLSPDLMVKFAGDVIVAFGVTLGIAPFMSVIDKSVVQRAAGTHTIIQSCVESVTTIVRNPASFVKSPMFVMMWGVYAATYTTGKKLHKIAFLSYFHRF